MLVSSTPLLTIATGITPAPKVNPITPPGGGRIGIDSINACPQLVKNPSLEGYKGYWEFYPLMPDWKTSPVYDGRYSMRDKPMHYGYSLNYRYLPSYEHQGQYHHYDAIAHVYIHKNFIWQYGTAKIGFTLEYDDSGPVILMEIKIPVNTTNMILEASVTGRVTITADIPDTYDRWLTFEMVVTDTPSNPSMDHVAFYYNGQLIWQGDVSDPHYVNKVMLYHGDSAGVAYSAYWDLIQFYDLDSC